MSKRLQVELIEVSGIRSMLMALRLPFQKDCRSLTSFHFSETLPMTLGDSVLDGIKIVSSICIDRKDLALIKTLIKRGDEHAKCVRGVMYYLKITAPRWWWVECSTYVVGTIPLGGTSTMHVDCKGLEGEELMEFKDSMPQGNLETRIVAFSLQTLQRILHQRSTHRLLIWQEFCEFIKTLPMNELITGKDATFQ